MDNQIKYIRLTGQAAPIRRIFCIASVMVAGLLGGSLRAEVVINELLGSTAAEDCEFIELYNSGSSEVDLTGWSIELWDSDADKAFGTADADSPIKLRGRIDAGGFFLLANTEFSKHFAIEPDQRFRDNGIENSSYTVVLKDSFGEIMETIFVSDGGEGDKPNISGRVFEPDVEISNAESSGRFIPPGFARLPDVDGRRAYRLLKFSPVPSPDATPGKPNVGAASERAEPDKP